MKSLSLAISQLGKVKHHLILPEIPKSLKYQNTDFKSQFLIEKRKMLGLSLMEVSKEMGTKNASKTARKLGEFEKAIKLPNDYANRLLKIYNIDSADFKVQISPDFPKNKKILDDNSKLKELNLRRHQILDHDLARIRREVIQNLSLFWDHFDEIINTPELYFSEIRDSVFSCAYVNFRDNHVYFGDLLTLWKHEKWLETCPDCGGVKYAFAAGGSPLSGNGGGWGFCPGCNKNNVRVVGERFLAGFFRPKRTLCLKRRPENLNPFEIDDILAAISSKV